MNRLQNLINRRDPEQFLQKGLEKAATLNETYRGLNEGEATKYLIGAMQPISQRYTEISFEQGDRVKEQLKNALDRTGIFYSFDYQGSVTNNTHVMGYSDIDLLTVNESFISHETFPEGASRYEGDTAQDMDSLRTVSNDRLNSSFPKATVDSSGTFAIAIEGGSLSRKVDVVPCNWYHSDQFKRMGRSKNYLGIQLYNSATNTRSPLNYPFLHNLRIEEKDNYTFGNFRKLTRLLKSLKYDSPNVDISSYDICAITYNMENSSLNFSFGMEVPLAWACLEYLKRLEANEALRNNIKVPNETRKVFCDEGTSLFQLINLRLALEALIKEVEDEIIKTSRLITNAQIYY